MFPNFPSKCKLDSPMYLYDSFQNVMVCNRIIITANICDYTYVIQPLNTHTIVQMNLNYWVSGMKYIPYILKGIFDRDVFIC